MQEQAAAAAEGRCVQGSGWVKGQGGSRVRVGPGSGWVQGRGGCRVGVGPGLGWFQGQGGSRVGLGPGSGWVQGRGGSGLGQIEAELGNGSGLELGLGWFQGCGSRVKVRFRVRVVSRPGRFQGQDSIQDQEMKGSKVKVGSGVTNLRLGSSPMNTSL